MAELKKLSSLCLPATSQATCRLKSSMYIWGRKELGLQSHLASATKNHMNIDDQSNRDHCMICSQRDCMGEPALDRSAQAMRLSDEAYSDTNSARPCDGLCYVCKRHASLCGSWTNVTSRDACSCERASHFSQNSIKLNAPVQVLCYRTATVCGQRRSLAVLLRTASHDFRVACRSWLKSWTSHQNRALKVPTPPFEGWEIRALLLWSTWASCTFVSVTAQFGPGDGQQIIEVVKVLTSKFTCSHIPLSLSDSLFTNHLWSCWFPAFEYWS